MLQRSCEHCGCGAQAEAEWPALLRRLEGMRTLLLAQRDGWVRPPARPPARPPGPNRAP